ncbi:SH3 domain-containing protein [Streptomyces sp. NPDC012794]|uniref:SH3 domain-containing protein n=1 Tax=Streptomyces sp. NPDC012794 TaxID=3364850 RepID=UPI0036989199
MLKPTRTILALAAGSMVLGLFGAGVAVADGCPVADGPRARAVLDDDPRYDEYDPGYEENEDEQSGDDGAVTYPKPRHALGRVVSQGPLKVRSKPTTRSKALGTVHPRQKLSIVCKQHGEKVDGNDLWYLLDRKHDRTAVDGEDRVDDKMYERKRAWVSARYVKDITPVRWCRS